jgi:adenylate cyclase
MPPESVQRRLAAILAADIVGFSRLMGRDEEGTHARLKALRAELVDPAIAQFGGRIFKTTGDGLLAEFASVVDAVKCAARVQVEIAGREAPVEEARRIVLRIGINLGDVIIDGDDIYGDGVNIAARLESLCAPGAIALSASAYEQVRDKFDYRFIDWGDHSVKNIARPVHVYGVDLSAQGIAASGVAPGKRAPARRAGGRWIAAAAVAMLALAGLALVVSPDAAKKAWSIVSRPGADASQDPRPAIAVLPFANQSGDATRDYFSDGITEDIIGSLGRFSGVRVISRNSVQAYKGREAKPEDIRRDLGVRYIVQGSVRQADDRLRVGVELGDAARGTQLWSERYEGSGREVFEIQDRIVKNIVGALAVKVTRLEQQRAVAKPAESLEAYDLVLRARSLMNSGVRTANREARDTLAQALKLAPGFAEAYVALAEAESLRSQLGWRDDPEEGMRRAEDLAQRALRIDDPGSNARAHALLGRANAFFARFPEALAEADRAIELNASDSVAYALRSEVLLYLGRLDDSITAGETARRFDPRMGSDAGFVLSMAYYSAGRLRESVATADSFIARYPENAFLHAIRAAALAQEGRLAEARQAADQVHRFSPFFQVEVFGTRFVRPEDRQRAQEGLRKAGL